MAAAVGLAVLTGAPTVGLTQDARPPAQQQQEARILRPATIQEAVDQWTPETRVIAIGNVGASDAELRALAAELRGKHWTIVIVGDATGQRYRDARNQELSDGAAIDFGTGQGLARKGAFEEQRNELGEKDGVVFTIVLNPKALHYSSSDAQKTRDLSDLKGQNLSRWAKDELKANRGAVAAARATVQNIERLMAEKIAAERSSAERAVNAAAEAYTRLSQRGDATKAQLESLGQAVAQARTEFGNKRYGQATAAADRAKGEIESAFSGLQNAARTLADSRQAVTAAQADVAALDKAAAALRGSGKTGALANPDLSSLRGRLTAAERVLASDPRGAAAQAGDVSQEAKDKLAEISGYDAAGRVLSDAESRLSGLQSKARKSAASAELLEAKQALDDARERWNRAEPGFNAQISAGTRAMDAAAGKIQAADAAAARNEKLFWMLMALLGLLTAGGSLFLALRARGARRRALERLADWDKDLDAKFEAMVGTLQLRMGLFIGAKVGGRGYKGKTGTFAERTRDDVSMLTLYHAKALSILDESRALIQPADFWSKLRNAFLVRGYDAAMKRLKDEPIVFKPEEGADAVYGSGKKRDWRDDLYGAIATQKPFTVTFEKLIEDFKNRAQRAVSTIDSIEKALKETPALLEAARGATKAVADKKPALDAAGAADGLFLMPSLFSKLLPAAEGGIAALAETFKTDPITVYESVGSSKTDDASERMAQDALALIDWALAARSGALNDLSKSSAALSAAGLVTQWIAEGSKTLSIQAERAAVAALTGSTSAARAALQTGAVSLARQAHDTVAASAQLALTATMDAFEKEISDARVDIGRALKLAAETSLREEGKDPSTRAAQARKDYATAKSRLDQGKADEAKTAFAALEAQVADGRRVLADTKRALLQNTGEGKSRRAETESILAAVEGAAAVLAAVSAEFAESVLALGAGDKSREGANGTIKDNVAEARAHAAESTRLTDEALARHREARVLEAAALLSQAASQQRLARERLAEIHDKKARLDAAVAANAAEIVALEGLQAGYEKELDQRTMKPTLAASKDSRAALVEARRAVETAKSDPFRTAARLSAARAGLDALWVAIRNDRDIFAEANRSIEAAGAQLRQADALARQAAADQVADSEAIRRATQTLERLEAELGGIRRDAEASNGDWNAVDREADRVTGEAATAAASLSSEIAAAAAAVSAVSSGADAVRDAANWTGSYGVYIPDSPGNYVLERAREALRHGRYQDASRQAESARSAARAAIAAAEAEVERRRLLHAEAESQIARAAGMVRSAEGWSGSYGISVSGRPGSDELDRARALIRDGHYEEASRRAIAAYAAAQSAIEQAEAAVERARRAAEEAERRRREAEEAERRRRQAEEDAAEAERQRQASSSNSDSSWGSTWGGSSGSSDSGSSGSSWGGSSDSGSSSSSWGDSSSSSGNSSDTW